MQHTGSPDAAPTSRGLVAGERVFGRFTLGRILGRGGMGVVWLARDETLEADVALKFLPDAVRWDPAALAALRRETRRSRELTHPHIVRVHDIHEDAGAAAIAMEYLAGGSLHQVRAARTPPVFTCAEIGVWLPGLCAALDHAHVQGVVHRDLKPGNLLVAADGAVKISDFGIAQPLFETALRVSQWAPSGTLAYMSPQQQFGEPVCAADDIYALGATLYELLTGKPPFYTGNLAAQIERRPPDSLAARRRQLGVESEPVPTVWEEGIAACLAKRAEDRPANATALAARLTASPSEKPTRKFVIHYMTNGLRWLYRWPQFLLLGVVVLAAGAGWWWKVVRKPTPAREATESAFASDATRALAAWNLDGDGSEAAGLRAHLNDSRTIPTTDRHGRIDRAVRFNGAVNLRAELPPALRWGGARPFTLSLWVRPEGTREMALLAFDPKVVGEFRTSLGLTAGRPNFYHGAQQVDGPGQRAADDPLPPGQWSHLAATYDGEHMRLFVNGRETGRQIRPAVNQSAPASAMVTLHVGQEHALASDKFVGDMDEVRVWHRALGAEEIVRLADPAPAPRFRMTKGIYADTDDLAAAVVREFGAGARVADWTSLKRFHADDTRGFLDELGLPDSSITLSVLRGGRRVDEVPRSYFVNRFEGVKPDYYDVHEELGGMTLALGSWYGYKGLVLAELPPAPPRIEPLIGHDGRVTKIFGPEQNTTALALRWSREFVRGAAEQSVRFELTTRDGRVLVAECRTGGGGSFALALGDAGRPQVARETAAAYDRVEFTVVLFRGRMEFRAVSGVGGTLLFRESVALPDLEPPQVARLTLTGVDSAELTVEE